MELITIPLDEELAQIYKNTSPENQQKLQILVGLWLRELEHSSDSNLGDLMDRISDNAQKRGLTAEILASLLGNEI